MNSFSHTNDNTPWWQVELVSTSTVQQIKMENRFCGDANDQTGCLCRLSRAKLSLLDDLGLVVAEQNIDDTCGELTVTLKFDNTFACSGETPSPTPSVAVAVPKARYLKLHSITGSPIHVFEIEVYSTEGINVALGKPATQSSSLNSFIASNAVDGNTQSFMHTNDSSPMWGVDLGSLISVKSVRIANRYCGDPTDPNDCLCRLSHSVLSLFDDQGNFVAMTNTGNTCDKLEWSYSFSDFGSSSACTILS